jgi:hypothetical protein
MFAVCITRMNICQQSVCSQKLKTAGYDQILYFQMAVVAQQATFAQALQKNRLVATQ